ncbi:T9SS type A sorting domain-containing protein [Hymenobacter sp. 102]|uniref:T9SS type A sorting domain-containing protein n=1 Tax=Hymenobacter sp. 102 TaxID=3403152 RepID=UPI003CE6E839
MRTLSAAGKPGTANKVAALPVAVDVLSTTNVPRTNTATQLTGGLAGTDTDNDLNRFRIVTLPPASQGTLEIANAALNGWITAAANTIYSSQQAQFLRFTAPASATVGTTSFTFRAIDAANNESSNTATYSFGVGTPNTSSITADIISSAAPATTLAPPLYGTNLDGAGTAVDFVINSVPNAGSQGVLALNGSAVTTGQVVTAAQASQLTFDPVASFFGTASFTYSARGNGSATDPTPATYAIPVSKSTCTDGRAVNFRAQADNEDWKATRTLTAGGITLTASNYTSAAAAAETQLQVVGGTSNKTLTWTTDYTGTTNVSSAVTLTLSQPVTGFTFSIGDIDKLVGTNANTGWEDVVKIDAYRADNSLVTLSAADVSLGNSNTFSGNNSITGTANSTSTAGNVVVTIPARINRVVITYSNAQPSTVQPNPGNQIITFNSFGWCSLADVATSITAPASLQAGQVSGNYTVTYANNGPDAATATTRVVTIPANTASAVTSASGTVTGSQAGGWTITYPSGTFASGNSVSYTFNLTPLPVANVTATATTTTGTDQGADTGANTASVTTAVTPVADITTTLNTAQTNVAPGTSITYTAQVNNNGPSPALSVVPTVQLPAGLNLVAANLPDGGSYDNNTGVVTFPTTSSLASGASTSYRIVFPAPNYNTTITGKASSTSTTTDPTTANNDGSQANANVATTVTLPANGCAGAQYGPTRSSGLYGEYFNGYFNDDLAFLNGKTAGLTRYDATLNYPSTASWGNLTPTAAGTPSNPDTYTARYRGSLNIATAGSYTLYLTSDDAAYLWLDGAALSPTVANALINNGGQHGSQERTATLNLSAGVHNLLVIYGENFGENVLRLEYASTNANVARQVIPNSVLCASASQPPVASNITNSPTIPDNNGPTAIAALSATDPDGQIDSYTILTLPNSTTGILYLASGSTLTAVTAGQVIPAASAGNLRFDPTVGTTSANFTYSATDNSGTVSNTATYTIPVGVSPAAINDQNFTAPNTAVSFNVTTNDTGAKDVATVDLDPNVAGIQTSKTVAGQGTFTVDNTGQVTFTPVNGFIGTAVIPYTINGTSGAVSNQANIAVTVRSLADVSTTISANASTVTAGQQVTLTVVTANSGAAGFTTATGVNQTVQLPAGLGTVTFSNGGSYNNTTGLVTLLSNGTLNAGASNTYGITFTAPSSGPVVGTAQVTTTSNETVLTNNLNSVSVNVTPTYDLTTRISGPATVVAGQPVTFSVSSLNLGTGLASNVAQTVTLPRNLTNVYVSNNGTYDAANGIVTFPTLATLPSGQNVNHVISFVAPAANATPISLVANISGAGNETPTNNNQASASLTVNAATTTNQANLFSTITASTSAPAPGEVYTYTVNFGNNGPATATSTSLRILLAPGLTVTGLPAGYSYNSTTGEITPSAVTATMVSGFSSSFTFNVTAPVAGTVLATSSIAGTTIDPVPGNNQTEVSVTVTPRTDLVTTIAGPSSATANQLVTYNVTAANNGAAAAAGTTQVVRIPAYLGTSNVTISGGGTYNNGTGEVTFSLGTLEAGQQLQNTVSFYMPTETQITATSSVATGTPETSLTNNTASVTTTGQRSSDVQVYLAAPASPIVVGTPVLYSVTTVNNGESAAASVTTTVQLPTGLTGVTVSGGGTYDAATGVVTFPARTGVAPGNDGTITNTISFVAPDGKRLAVVATANVSNATNDLDLSNNVALSNITVNQPTTTFSDLAVTISANAATYTAGSPITYTVTVTNNGTATATDVRTRIALPGDLTGFTSSTGSSYNANTGIVQGAPATDNISLASGASTTYTFSVNAPAAGPVLAVASVSSDVSDNVPANNISQTSVNVTALADVETIIDGVGTATAGNTVSYTVITRNNGTSPASNVQQTVQLPTGLTGVTVSGGGTYDSGSGVVTFPAITTLNSGNAQAVTNTISFPFPTASYRLVANVSTGTTETATSNNTDGFTTNIANQAPVARNVVNNITAPDATNAAVAQPISALFATDADGNIRSFTISNLPNTTTQGTLYVNGVEATENQVVLLADASKLSFKPVNGFVGNAFFTYTALDNNNLVSNNTAVYTLPVASDNNSAYATTPTKGGANQYQNNDVLAYVVDPNGAVYSSTGTVYDATTGALVTNASNGLPTSGTNATISAADQNKLSAVGLALNPATGQVYVINRSLLKQGTYSVSITTTDIYGGVTTQTVNVPVGANPLPVTLTAFTAQAAGQDAKLTWNTAQEVNNDHFLVERSFDGQQFSAIQQVKGQGTKATATSYTAMDAQVAPAAQGRVVYYRLRQVDTDGTSSFSSVQAVRFPTTIRAAVEVYPNPASGQQDARLDLSTLSQGTYQVTITDMAGRTVRTFAQPGGSTQLLQVTELPTGSYLIQVRGNEQSFTKRLVKE